MFFANIFSQLWTNSEIMNGEQSHVLSLACDTVCVSGLVFFYYMCWIFPVHQASCSYQCDQTKSEVAKPSLAELEPNPNWESAELELNPNYNNDRTEQNPNLRCWVRFPSLVGSLAEWWSLPRKSVKHWLVYYFELKIVLSIFGSATMPSRLMKNTTRTTFNCVSV